MLTTWSGFLYFCYIQGYISNTLQHAMTVYWRGYSFRPSWWQIFHAFLCIVWPESWVSFPLDYPPRGSWTESSFERWRHFLHLWQRTGLFVISDSKHNAWIQNKSQANLLQNNGSFQTQDYSPVAQSPAWAAFTSLYCFPRNSGIHWINVHRRVTISSMSRDTPCFWSWCLLSSDSTHDWQLILCPCK